MQNSRFYYSPNVVLTGVRFILYLEKVELAGKESTCYFAVSQSFSFLNFTNFRIATLKTQCFEYQVASIC